MMSPPPKKHLATSPERGSFQMQMYIEKLSMHPNDQTALEMIEYYQADNQRRSIQELDPEWQKINLEYDLRTCEWICDKVMQSNSYAQNLYAALCNNDFQKLEVMPILQSKTWSCSWRYAGGIIAHMRRQGDYIDWYCSGIKDDDSDNSYVAEGIVTEEIADDLKNLGWIVIDGD